MPGAPGGCATLEEDLSDMIEVVRIAFDTQHAKVAQMWRNAATQSDDPEWKTFCAACAEAWESSRS